MSPVAARWLAPVAGLMLGLSIFIGVAFAAAPRAWAADPQAPTVIFTNGSQSRACRSAPAVTSLTVPEGTAFAVTNALGRDAVVYVGGSSVLAVDDDDGALLMLSAGQHDVRMVPECLEFSAAGTLTVTVTGSEPTPADTTQTSAASVPSPAADPTSAPAPPAAGAGGSQPNSATTGAGPVDSAALETVAATTADPTADSPTAARPRSGSGVAAAGVISAEPLTLDDESHSKGLRLLAAVATICVLGVTAAIIRAIVRLSP
jgi:hypothetical protein